MKTTARWLMVMVLGISVTSSGLATAEAPRRGGTLTIGMTGDFANLDPYFDFGVNRPLYQNVYDQLVRLDQDLNVVPHLAESVTVSEDGLAYTVVIRPNVRFHNGRLMTSEDIKYNVLRAADKSRGHSLWARFEDVEKVTIQSDVQLTIELSTPNPYFFSSLVMLPIIPPENEPYVQTQPIGTGPFVFRDYTPGVSATLERFEDYWRPGLPYLDRVVIRFFADDETRLVNLETGGIDLVHYVPLKDIPRLESNPQIVLDPRVLGGLYYSVYAQVERPPLDNRLVRQALNYALDRQTIAANILYTPEAVTCIPFPEMSWAHDVELASHYTFDLDKARSLLTEAGYEGGLHLELMVHGPSSELHEAAVVYQADLRKIGVDLDIQIEEPARFYERQYESDFDLVMTYNGYGAYNDPSFLFTATAYRVPNYTRWTSPRYEELIRRGKSSVDPALRSEIYAELTKLITEESFVIVMGFRPETFGYAPYVKGIQAHPIVEYYLLDEAWLDR